MPDSFTVSPPGHPNSLRLKPSLLNLTALNGNYAGPTGQTFVARRQQDTLFTYSVDLDFSPSVREEEAGVTVFLTQNHHLDMGVVMLPANSSTAAFPGTNRTATTSADLVPHVRFRGISYVPVPDPVIVPLPATWTNGTLRLEIKASNMTHYSFSIGPADKMSETQTIINVSNQPVSWGFTGEFCLGVALVLQRSGLIVALQVHFSAFTVRAMAVQEALRLISRSGPTRAKDSTDRNTLCWTAHERERPRLSDVWYRLNLKLGMIGFPSPTLISRSVSSKHDRT
jgi:hypothetical protein